MFKISKELLENIHKGPVILGKNLPPVAVHFMYIRDPDNNPVVTICILSQGFKTLAEGIAICSKDDNFSKSFGRELSLYRAVKALTSKRSSLNIRHDLHRYSVDTYATNIRYKSAYYPPEVN